MVTVKDLKKLDVFGVLSDKQLTDLSKITEKKTYQSGQHVYESGDRAKCLFVILKGCVGLRELAPGDAIGVGFEHLERGEVFGCASLMKPQRYTLSAVCEEDTEVLSIDAGRLHEVSEKDPELGLRLMTKIADAYMSRFETAKRQIHQMVRTPTIIMALPG
jgi:CRP-like cAMP-binding protein